MEPRNTAQGERIAFRANDYVGIASTPVNTIATDFYSAPRASMQAVDYGLDADLDDISLSELIELERRLLFQASRIALGDSVSGLSQAVTEVREEIRRRRTEQDVSQITAVMKERHLNPSERQVLHQPKSDWEESSRGEVCKSAFTLEVKDLVEKYK